MNKAFNHATMSQKIDSPPETHDLSVLHGLPRTGTTLRTSRHKVAILRSCGNL
jgi:hypothetical protein